MYFKNSVHEEQVYWILYAVVKKLQETYDTSDQ